MNLLGWWVGGWVGWVGGGGKKKHIIKNRKLFIFNYAP